GPNNTLLTTQPFSGAWPAIDRPVRVADTEWTVRFAYEPVDENSVRATRYGAGIGGSILALALAALIYVLQRSISRQLVEIKRREAAEYDARQRAAPLSWRASDLQRAESVARGREEEARELATQLSSAQIAAQRLSTSLDPEEVVEFFLGTVGELLG